MKTILEFIKTGKLQNHNNKTLRNFIEWLYECDYDDLVKQNALDDLWQDDWSCMTGLKNNKEITDFVLKNADTEICSLRVFDNKGYGDRIKILLDFGEVKLTISMFRKGWEEDPFVLEK